MSMQEVATCTDQMKLFQIMKSYCTLACADSHHIQYKSDYNVVGSIKRKDGADPVAVAIRIVSFL
jgi:hypothetical protein